MLNKVLLVGRLVRDPVIRYLPSGMPVTEFSVVYNRRYKVNEEWKEESHFFDIKAYGKFAEGLVERLSKGYMVIVEGRLSQERWTSSEGEPRTKVRIVAESVKIVSKPKSEQILEEIESEDVSVEDIEKDLKKLEPPFKDEEDEIPF